MLPIAVCLLSITTLFEDVTAKIDMMTKPRLLQANVTVSRNLLDRIPNQDMDSTISYNIVSSGSKEIRRCKELNGPTRSLTLTYTYLVESFLDIDFHDIETTLFTSIAEMNLVLACKSFSSSEDHLKPRTVAFEASVEGGVSDNFCHGDRKCHIVRRTMTLAVQGENTENDSQLLVEASNAVELSINQLSSENIKISYISDRPTITSTFQEQLVIEPAGKGFGIFPKALIVVSAVGSTVVLAVVAFNQSEKKEEKCCMDGEVLDHITISQRLDDKGLPSDRCLDISPCNLDAKQFIYVDDNIIDLHWITADFRHIPDGFVIDIETNTEVEELEWNIEGSVISF